MDFPYHFFIALRYFRSKKKHRGVSVNTIISVSGVALGVMALIIVLSVMGGFHEDLQKKILGVNAHIVVLNYSGKIKEYDLLIEKINGIQGVSHSSPFIYGQVMLGSKDRAYGAVVRGVDPEVETETTEIINYIKEGSIIDLNRDGEEIPGLVLGRELARKLGLFIGDEINMISPSGEIGPLGMLPKMKKFRLVGVFEVGMFEYDSNLALVHIQDAQNFFNYHDEITGVEIKVDEIYKSEKISEDIEAVIGPPYYARDWMDMNRNLFSALKLEKLVMFIILILIVLVASFNIISNLIMIVMEKSREIAVLKAMGATGRGVMSVFMIHGLLIGIIGTGIGLSAGYVVCQLLKTYKFISLPPDIYYLSYLPVRMSLFDLIMVPAAAIIISFLATVYPSWQASRLDPVEPLRYE
jgi:lipoprotein-releasing system permease protein